MRRIHPRATKSSTCRMSIGFSKPSTSPSPMADQTFRLPDLGEGLTEAQLVTWRVKEGGHVGAAPFVRQLAKEKGVDLARLTGSGPDGRITRADVEAATSRATPTTPAGVATTTDGERRISVVGIRKAIARQMVRSISTIPQFTEFAIFDASTLMAARERQKTGGQSMTPLPYFIRAMVKAVRAFPMVNSSWDESRDEIIVKEAINVGIAVNTNQGLLVPVLRGADQLDLVTIAAQSARLIEGARAGTLKPGEMTGGTITVTNVGAIGPVETGTPIIRPPACCG